MIKKRVREIIAEITHYGTLSDITMGLSFEEDMDLSETVMFELCEALEEEYDIEITPYISDFETVKQLIDFIEDGI